MQNVMLLAATIFAFAMPLGLMIWWKKRCDLSLKPFIIGALCFILFALVLEQAAHSFFLITENPVSAKINSTPWLRVLYGALAAGIFEETGRLFGFRVMLRNDKKKEVSAAYGIGHGGIEAVMTLGVTYVMLTLFSFGIRFGDSGTDAAFSEALQNLSAVNLCLAMLERTSAMMLHIGLSVLVFLFTVQPGKRFFFPLAVVLHALCDVIPGLYQVGLMTDLVLIEGLILLFCAAVLFFSVRAYKAYQPAES